MSCLLRIITVRSAPHLATSKIIQCAGEEGSITIARFSSYQIIQRLACTLGRLIAKMVNLMRLTPHTYQTLTPQSTDKRLQLHAYTPTLLSPRRPLGRLHPLCSAPCRRNLCSSTASTTQSGRRRRRSPRTARSIRYSTRYPARSGTRLARFGTGKNP